jgi:hypothetical protein
MASKKKGGNQGNYAYGTTNLEKPQGQSTFFAHAAISDASFALLLLPHQLRFLNAEEPWITSSFSVGGFWL